MNIAILYCRPCGYRSAAESLADELRERFGVAVAVEEGKFGQFDVLLNGELVASKGRSFVRRMLTHGAPPQHEIVEALDRHLGGTSA